MIFRSPLRITANNKFNELLEMIGRIAEVKYQNTENEVLSLAEKICLVLDIIL